VLHDSIAKRMAPAPVKLRACFELICFTSEGIDAIKDTLITAKKAVNEENFVIDVYNHLHLLVQNYCTTLV
jgi:translation initiation factor 2 alpha subunit (eIF-2alpha)